MTKKTFTVFKAVKLDGVELAPGEDIALEPGQAERLMGTFVEEKVATKHSGSVASTTGKGKDGL
jgi:hypothetical protein